MERKIQLLDCTLRDGAYVVDANFGMSAVKGIIKKLQDANVDIIECGWLKNDEHEFGTSFFHQVADLKKYIHSKNKNTTYVAMIDWDRYDVAFLEENDGTTFDAIRVVFPHGKVDGAIEVARKIKDKGYKVYFQFANTLAYSNKELSELARKMNEFMPESVSVVDTFGAMYHDDLRRIVELLDKELDTNIKLGFHSHNNQQLSFALTIHFIELLQNSTRSIVVDSSLCGMGRGAGNTTTELIANYLNTKYSHDYDMNAIMDCIDLYMQYFIENYTWGYSTPYFIAGMYCCHVNNIAYLQKNHRTNARDMRNIIESLSPADRRKYDYDLLEEKYMENQNRHVDDEVVMEMLAEILKDREVLLIAPGKSSDLEFDKIKAIIDEKKPIVIGVNALNEKYQYDYLFLINSARYDYAKEVYSNKFKNTKKILLSNIKVIPNEDELIINFERVVKRGWEHFDNAVINCLRLMNKLAVEKVYLAGFDAFGHKYNDSYADSGLPTLNPDDKWDELNEEIKDMYLDFKKTVGEKTKVKFLTESIFNL